MNTDYTAVLDQVRYDVYYCGKYIGYSAFKDGAEHMYNAYAMYTKLDQHELDAKHILHNNMRTGHEEEGDDSAATD